MSDLAKALFGERAATATGEFRIDPKKAREKLQKFRLPEPHLYVLQFVRAASVLGASRIDFEVSTTEVTCQFNAELPPGLLADIWNIAFRERRYEKEVAAHHLALGLGSAQALNPERIVVESGRGILTLLEEGDHFGDNDDRVDGTRIFLKEKFQLGHVSKFFTTVFSVSPEFEAIWRYCSFATMTIRINGETLAERARTFSNPYEGAQPLFKRLILAPADVVFEGEAVRGSIKLIDDPQKRWARRTWQDPLGLATPPMPRGGPRVDRTRFALIKDDVYVGEATFEPHGVTAHGVVHSRRIRSDISGLSVIRDDRLDDLVLGAPIGAYHRALLRRATEHGEVDRLQLAAEVFRFHRQLVEERRSPAPGSTALREWLEDQPLFLNADRDGPLGFTPREVVRGGEIRTSRVKFSRRVVDREGPVVFVDRGTSESDPRHAGMFRALLAWASYVQVQFVDITDRIELAQRRWRSVNLWANQPPVKPPDFPFQERVEVDGKIEAFVYLPVRSAEGSLEGLSAGLRLHLQDKLLYLRPWSLPLGFHLRGSFTPTDSHDGIVIDDAVKRLLGKMIRVVPRVYEAYARALVDTDTAPPLRPHPIDQWVDSLLEGTFGANVLRLGGVDGEELGALLDEIRFDVSNSPFAIADIVASDEPVTTPVMANLLGAVADVRSFESFDGARYSLRELLDTGDELLLTADTPWTRRFLASVDELFEGGLNRRVILANPLQLKILLRLAPHTQDARAVLSEALAERQFLSRHPWKDPVPASEVLASIDGAHGGERFRLQLLARPDPSGPAVGVHVVLLLQDRLLAQKSFETTGPGALRAIVHCESLKPTEAYDDVVKNVIYDGVRAKISVTIDVLRDLWFSEARSRHHMLVGRKRKLYFELAMLRAGRLEWEQEPFIPIITHPGGERRLVSPAEIAATIESVGGILPYTTTVALDASLLPPNCGLAVDIEPAIPTSTLRPIAGDAHLVDVSVEHRDRDEARRRFIDHGETPRAITARLVTKFSMGGIDVKIGMFEGMFHGAAPRQVRASVLYEGRTLERLDVPVPFGSFRAIVEGDPITPDANYTAVVGGRPEVFEALRHAAAGVVREACATIDDLKPSPELEPLRDELIRMMEVCHDEEPAPPFDLAGLFESTLLFRTTTGERLTFRELGRLASDGKISYSHHVESDDLLHVLPGHVALYDRVIAAYDLVPEQASTFDEPSATSEHVAAEPAPTEGPQYEDPLLRRVVALLIEARGGRTDLLDDHVAFAVRWADHGEPVDDLCKVTSAGVVIERAHPLVECVADRPHDGGAVAYLASAIYSEINRYYETITDPDEVAFQARFLASRRSPERP